MRRRRGMRQGVCTMTVMSATMALLAMAVGSTRMAAQGTGAGQAAGAAHGASAAAAKASTEIS